ncbi:unnamed protein product, partial [Callosobruchus maculatus]
NKQYSREEKHILSHIIVKGFPKNKTRRHTFRSADFFETEVIFYDKVWPILKKLKESKNIQEVDEVPQMLACFCDGNDDFVAMVDISYDGYKSIGRQDKITRQHISLFLKLLAHFHALSIAAKEQVPGFVEVASSLKETYFTDRLKDWYNGFLHKRLYHVVRHAVEHELSNEYLAKIDKFFQRDLYSDLCKMIKRQSKLSVVTEGDAWLPNFLIKENNNGIPENAVLIDFQLSRYATLTNDLIHFLFAGVPDYLESNWDELIEEYYQYFSGRIEELGTDKNIVSLVDLREDIEENSHVGLTMAMEATVMSLLDDDEVADLDDLKGDHVPLEEVWNVSPFKDDERNKRLACLIKQAVD